MDDYLEATLAIEKAREKFPDLTLSGFKVNHSEEFNLDNIVTAMTFLRLCRPVSNPTYSSYHLKHVAEDFGRRKGMKPYITNGELIVAAVGLDFVVRRFDNKSPNAHIGVSRRDVERVTDWNERGRPDCEPGKKLSCPHCGVLANKKGHVWHRFGDTEDACRAWAIEWKQRPKDTWETI